MTQYQYQTHVPKADRDTVIDLFFAVKDELRLPDRAAVVAMVDLIYAKGFVVGAYYEGKLVGAGGCFFGDPAEDFADKSVLFFYVAAILPDFRGTRLFHGCLVYLLRHIQGTGVTEIRMQAETTNPFTNKLYGRFATQCGTGKTLRGIAVNNYAAPITDALVALTRRKRPSAAQARAAQAPAALAPAAQAPTPHHAPPVTVR